MSSIFQQNIKKLNIIKTRKHTSIILTEYDMNGYEPLFQYRSKENNNI